MSSRIESKVREGLLVSWRRFRNCPMDKDSIRELLSNRRRERIRLNYGFLKGAERAVMDHVIDGRDVNMQRIAPFLDPIRGSDQFEIYRYLRFTSSYAFATHVGRCMSFFVRDAGQPGKPIMGIASLGSPVRNLAVRDSYIGWTGKVRIKAANLQHVMDLITAVSIPPYNWLLGGKLICLLMVSNEVRNDFRIRYPETRDLVLITTTSIFGKNCSQYNRLRIGQRKLFEYIGDTKGYGHAHIPDRVFAQMRKFVEGRGILLPATMSDTHNWKLTVVSRAIRALGLPERKFLRHGLAKGVFVSPLASNAGEFLRNETSNPLYLRNSSSDLISFWKQRWLGMRIKNEDVLRAVSNWRKSSLSAKTLLSGLLPHRSR